MEDLINGKNENKPIEKRTNSFKKSKFLPKINTKILADYKYVKKSIKKKNVVIIDFSIKSGI